MDRTEDLMDRMEDLRARMEDLMDHMVDYMDVICLICRCLPRMRTRTTSHNPNVLDPAEVCLTGYKHPRISVKMTGP